MTEQQVIELMESSTSEMEWNANVDQVTSVCDGYPDFWWPAIIQSGLGNRVAAQWGGDAELHIHPF